MLLELLPAYFCPSFFASFFRFNYLIIAFLIHKRYIPDPEQLNQQRFKCAAQMREPLYTETFRITRVRIWGNFRHITPFCGLLTIS
ncbi:hypothetical protein B1L04_19120 [Microcystis aeruginosa KW]|uniref:Uncharacterized protein n=1 Tax=Microcystis aeruginosa KW TaxID=1960155 RepID=A0A1V4BUS2_MICAE|nr:hypothetical protein B1L04_19120 [Microcystis aeruginosa KW]